jgi:hypothetical protein
VAALVVASLAPRAPADQIEVSLNVLYSNVADPLSGGSWEIAAKSDGFGIAGLQLLLTGITAGSEQLVAPRSFVNGTDPAGMSTIDSFNLSGFREVDIIQRQVAVLDGGEEQSIFYGIGTLTNGSPDFPGAPIGSNSIGPTFTSLTNTFGLPWAPSPPGDVLGDPSWDSAAVLVNGTFSAGATPAFYSDPTHISSGNLYTSLGTSTTVGTQTLIESLMTTVRTNLLSVFPDYNDNGFVDAADYTVWRDAMTAGTPLFNDATPGTVDEDDFLFWRQYFGAVVPGFGGGSAAGAGAGLAAAAVPEPTTWTLLLGAVGMLLFRPRIGLLRNVRVR